MNTVQPLIVCTGSAACSLGRSLAPQLTGARWLLLEQGAPHPTADLPSLAIPPSLRRPAPALRRAERSFLQRLTGSLDGASAVVLVACLGGETGGVWASMIADRVGARVPTACLVTLPWTDESETRHRRAAEALALLQERAHLVVPVQNLRSFWDEEAILGGLLITLAGWTRAVAATLAGRHGLSHPAVVPPPRFDGTLLIVGVGGDAARVLALLARARVEGVLLVHIDEVAHQHLAALGVVQISAGELDAVAREQLHEALTRASLGFVLADLGGVCGSSMAPAVAGLVRERLPTIGLVTSPSPVKSSSIRERARASEAALQRVVDTVVALPGLPGDRGAQIQDEALVGLLLSFASWSDVSRDLMRWRRQELRRARQLTMTGRGARGGDGAISTTIGSRPDDRE